MATAGDGATPYQSGGAGGKFRKKPIRPSAQAKPYDRSSTAIRNSSPSLFAKLVDPASRLIYAGADRLFGVFRKRLPSIAAPRPPETREEPKPSTDEGGNLASISATTEISELESMLKQKTFTRSEIEHLTALLHAKTTNSDGDEGNRAKLPSPSSHFLRLEASTSKHVVEREKENIYAAILTPVVTSRAFEEDGASPAELARAYMGSRTPKVSPSTLRFGSQAPRQDSVLINTTTILPKTPRTAGSFKGYENGLTTPRSRGRSAIYSMARTPYYRPPSTFSQKGINSPSLPLSQEGSVESSKMALKRRSSVLDDIGCGGPVRRIRQKANLLSQGSPLSKSRSGFGQKLLLRNEAEPIEEKGETSRSNLGYASVPTKSTQMATKILEQLEGLSPKEKSSRLARTSEKSPLTLTLTSTSNTIHGQEKVNLPKLMSSCQDNNKKPESLLLESTSQGKGKEKVEENGGPRKFAVPRNVLSTMNGNSGLTLRDNGPVVAKVPLEPPQKKRFQMSAHEDYLEVDDDSHSNGHVFGQNKKPETFVFGNKDVSAEDVHTPALPPQVDKITGMQKADDAKSHLPKTNFGSVDGSVVVNKKVTFNITTSGDTTQPAVLPQITDAVAPQKKPTTFTKNVPPILFPASGFKLNTSPDAKPLPSISLFDSVKENNEVQENGNGVKCVNVLSKSEALPSSTSGIFSFGANAKTTTNISNGAPSASSPSPSPSTFVSGFPFPVSTTATNNLFSGGSLLPSTTTTTTTTTPSPSFVLPTSTPAPIFTSGPASTKSDIITTSPFATTSFATATTGGSSSSVFGFTSSAPTSTANDHHQSQGSLFISTTTSGFQTSSSLFGSSAPCFGLSSTGVATSEIKSGSTPIFGLNNSSWQSPNSSTPFSFGATSSSPNLFGSSSSPSMFSFSATSSAFPVQSHTATPPPPNNNDQMSVEDTMAEDSTPTPSVPAFGQPSSGGFNFGSATPPPSTVPFHFGGQTNQPPQLNSFQTSTPLQNPFASGSGEFSAGGSFSLGSGGGDKSGRRFVRVKNKGRKK